MSLWLSKNREFFWRHLFTPSLKLSKFTRFKQKQILLKKFVEFQFEVRKPYEFQTKANSCEDISSFSVWSYLSLRVSRKTDLLWRHLLSLSLKLSKFRSFKQNQIFMKTFVESRFEVIYVYEFQTTTNPDKDICWVSTWRYVNSLVSSKSQFLWRHLLSFSLKLCKFMSFKPKRILMKTFVESRFKVFSVYEF